MKEKIVSGFFSISGLSMVIGCAGFISAFVTMFVNTSDQISIKWIIFTVLTLGTIVLILLKIIFDLYNERRTLPPYETPIKYIKEENVFVIRRNENFVSNIILGCYAQIDGIDRLAYLGFVHIIQDKIIQIKIKKDFKVLDQIPETLERLKNVLIRPVVPITALDQIDSQGN